MSDLLSNYLPRVYHRSTEFWNREMQDLEISSAEIPYLPILHRLGSATQEQLAGELQVHKSAVTKCIKSLEAKGLVTRVQDEKDLRCMRVSLTEKGLTCWSIMETRRIKWREIALKGISEEDAAVTESVLMKMMENFREYRESNASQGKIRPKKEVHIYE